MKNSVTRRFTKKKKKEVDYCYKPRKVFLMVHLKVVFEDKSFTLFGSWFHMVAPLNSKDFL